MEMNHRLILRIIYSCMEGKGEICNSNSIRDGFPDLGDCTNGRRSKFEYDG